MRAPGDHEPRAGAGQRAEDPSHAHPHPSRPPGIDFTVAPSRRKPATVARGRMLGGVLRLDGVVALQDLTAFERVIAEPGPWAGAFDSPFALPRAFVEDQALGGDADAVIAAVRSRCAGRMAWRAFVDAWGNTRPAGAAAEAHARAA